MIGPDPQTGILIVLAALAYFGGMAAFAVFVVGPTQPSSTGQLVMALIFWPVMVLIGATLFAGFWVYDAIKRQFNTRRKCR